ncbi:Mediator of RNA polymerase II transcription subunit 21 [Penicillium hetheringtonii]|uniref:Mediator of RNA polymerase II transcription subunit 21 n=1 Tax=Penicillium hetheringtonii TaxID=911720 RepID=A0AAD6DW35_9EURO|nr:Mediator of RNA polymerase II transcription subunit 21 [Penicillium hetheringtonii]
MADILTQLQTCLDQLATQFYATLGYLSTYHDNSPAIPPPNVPDAAPALARMSKNTTSPPIPASVAASAEASGAGPAASPPPPQPQQPGAAPGAAEIQDPNQPPEPDPPRTFASRQRELARDLIIKEQQIEYLISVLPGIGTSEAEQEAKIRELEVQLREVEEKREAKALELKKLRGKLENVLGAVSVGIYGDKESQHDTVSA